MELVGSLLESMDEVRKKHTVCHSITLCWRKVFYNDGFQRIVIFLFQNIFQVGVFYL